MRLDRNVNGTGRGKYGLVNNRKLFEVIAPAREEGDDNDTSMVKLRKAMMVRAAIELLEEAGILDWGMVGTESEFFVIKLRDKFAYAALDDYAMSAHWTDPEYAMDVRDLANRAGSFSKFCKTPD